MKTENNISRRQFLKSSALIGGSAVVASKIASANELMNGEDNDELFYKLALAENIVYTTCLNCNTGCGLKAKIIDGVLAKVDGSPFSPWTMHPHLPYDKSPADPEVARLDGAICPKGQAGIQILYDPYRIRKVLKRAGKRGSGKWESISFDQAVKEIVGGGKLFAHISGEEDRVVEGLNDICKLRDPVLAKVMKADVELIKKKEMTVETFKRKHSQHLDVLIDPNHPDLGPKNNQMVFNWGRMKAGRSQFVQRFVNDAFGSVNRHGHTTVCQGSLYFACKAMSEQYTDGKWKGGKKFYWQADIGHSDFVMFVGSNAFEGGYGPPLRTSKITTGVTERNLKFAVVDPRMGKLGGMAWKWIPAKPGSEAAMALAMTRWIIENERYDKQYLTAANRAAAQQVGEPNWSNAAWLVKINDDGTPGDFLRAGDLPSKYWGGNKDRFVVLNSGKIKLFSPEDGQPAFGNLLIDTKVEGIRVKSSMQLLFESAREKSIEEWAKICDVEADEIILLANEFTSHGKKAAIDIHRGVSQHTNGYYNVTAWMSLNLLIGNFGWKGGMSSYSTYDVGGGKKGQPFPLSSMNPSKLSPFGLSIIRHDEEYDKSTLFKDYPAKRPWYPLSSDVYQEVIPSIGDQYPYPVKALILYNGAPNYSLPAGDQLNAILSETEKLPLFIANDITVGETSVFADYIFPDGTYFERWEFHGSHPNVIHKVQGIRTPVVTPLVDTCKVFGEEMPMTLESMLMGFAEQMKLPGFGENGFGNGEPLSHFDQFYLKMVANICAEDTAIPDCSDEEYDIFLKSRRHITRHSFSPDRWKASVGEQWWRKVVYAMVRGGRFQNYHDSFKGEQLANAYKYQINLYHEKTARTKDSMTGKPFSGIPKYNPVKDSLSRVLDDESKGFDLQLSTFRQSTQTKARTNGAYWLLSIHPQNYVLINRNTAQEKGLANGDMVRIISNTNASGQWKLEEVGDKPVVGEIKVIEGIRPGVVSFSLGYGHWANGARNIEIDSQEIAHDERRARGIHANAVMGVDPHLKNTCLSDTLGGSAVFYDTWVKIEKV